MTLNERETAIAWAIFCVGITRPKQMNWLEISTKQAIFNDLMEKGRRQFFPSISHADLDLIFRETTSEILRIETMLGDVSGT